MNNMAQPFPESIPDTGWDRGRQPEITTYEYENEEIQMPIEDERCHRAFCDDEKLTSTSKKIIKKKQKRVVASKFHVLTRSIHRRHANLRKRIKSKIKLMREWSKHQKKFWKFKLSKRCNRAIPKKLNRIANQSRKYQIFRRAWPNKRQFTMEQTIHLHQATADCNLQALAKMMPALLFLCFCCNAKSYKTKKQKPQPSSTKAKHVMKINSHLQHAVSCSHFAILHGIMLHHKVTTISKKAFDMDHRFREARELVESFRSVFAVPLKRREQCMLLKAYDMLEQTEKGRIHDLLKRRSLRTVLSLTFQPFQKFHRGKKTFSFDQSFNLSKKLSNAFNGSQHIDDDARLKNIHEECNFFASIILEGQDQDTEHECNAKVLKATYFEEAEIKLLQPPSRLNHDYKDEQERIQSFVHLVDLTLSPQAYASAGFYLSHGDVVKCCFCLKECLLSSIDDRNFWNFHESSCQILQRTARQVVSDGRVSDEIGDPPGQQSVYIPPGDVRNETYRLSTFEHFPVSCPTSRRGLAKSGFYYTGFFDRVKCFACGRSVERWEARDDPAELRWHKPACPFPKGEPCGNIPINDIFNRLSTNALTRQSQSRDEVIHQTDPNTGAIIRTVRYPADLPERIRRTGGTFHIGPGNALTIQSGPGPSGSGLPVRIGNQSLSNDPPEQRPFRLANVVSPDHRRFLSNLFLNRELDRLSSFGRWPVSRPTIPPAALARSGFFYLGDMDRTQCFSCSGVLRNWTIEDDAIDEHRNHFPNCKMVLRTEDRNVPIPEEDPSPENREQLFPCRYPSNPHMRNEAARLATFDQRWPRRTVGAAPAVIAQAGFFFLGERDRVKCWYCNGGLQNWEYDDLPWIEHAKWFPNCQFVLQKQGVRFVYRNLSLYPHLNRPIIARQEGATIDPAGTNTPRAGLAMSSRRGEDIAPVVRPPSPPPTIIDPQVEMRKKKERISNIIKNSEVVKTVTGMGFSEDTVRHVLEEKIDSGNVTDQNNIFDSATSLLDAVMEYENRMEEEEEEQPGPPADEELSHLSFHSMSLSGAIGGSLGPAPGSGLIPQVRSFAEDEEMMEDRDIYGSINESVSGQAVAQNSVAPVDKKSLQETLDKMEEERQCKVCFSNPADMVFVPCGHMICCMDCTQALRQCPVCRKKIEKAIKTYVK